MSKIAIAVPASNNKFYSGHQHLRTLRHMAEEQDNVRFYFILDQAHYDIPVALIGEFCRRYPKLEVEVLFCPLPPGLNTDEGDGNQWEKRARIAAELRQVAFERAREQSDVSHLFMGGCDMLFPRDSVSRLLALDHPLVTGIYTARISNYAIILSYDRETKGWHPVPRQPGIFEVDWCGSDFLLIRRDVFEKVDYTGFNCQQYNAGEDAWICHRTFEEFGTRVKVDGDLFAEHVNPNGSVAYPVPFYADIYRQYCPSCEWSLPRVRPYRDQETVCGGCHERFPVLPFWEDVDVILEDAVYMPLPKLNLV